MTRHCPLCAAERITRRYHEDDVCWIADCSSCGVPLGVLKVHIADAPDPIKRHVEARMRELFGDDGVIDWTARSIPDHAHCHLRGVEDAPARFERRRKLPAGGALADEMVKRGLARWDESQADYVSVTAQRLMT